MTSGSAGVNMQDLSRDIARRRQVQDPVHDVTDLAHASERWQFASERLGRSLVSFPLIRPRRPLSRVGRDLVLDL